jgi:hypothetical protein
VPKRDVNRKIIRELRRSLEYVGAEADSQNLDPSDLYKRLDALGADRELLAIVGSWRDTLDDEEILALLTEWNAVEAARRN